jgi:uncharacterized protein YprB with RNaseH-like and TPR domain
VSDEPRILVWDIETTNLNASFGTVLAIAYKWVGKSKVHIPTILDFNEKGHMLNDKPLIEKFLEVYCTADYTVAHYGKRFDRPFIQTKCLKHRLGPMPDVPLMDTCDVAWKNFKLHSNRLAAWLEYLGCEHEKMPMRTDDWLNAAHGCPKAMKAVKARAEKDVLGLEEVFLAMRPWMKEPIRQEGTQLCISCGSGHLQHRGTYRTLQNVFPRLQCQSCGKWQRENKTGTKLSAA